jgi:hypothetical protein
MTGIARATGLTLSQDGARIVVSGRALDGTWKALPLKRVNRR